MKRTLTASLALAALVAVAPLAIAQQPPFPPEGGPRHGGPQKPPRGPRGPMGPQLLLHPKVQQELRLTNAQVEQIRNAMPRPPRPPQGGDNGQGRPPMPPPPPSPEERERVEATINGILSQDQYTRYRQIGLQVQGPGALMRKNVSQALNLSGDQRERIREILEQNRPPMPPPPPGGPGGPGEGEMPPPPPGGPGGPPRPDPEARKRVEAKIMAVLTEAQRSEWKSMLGRPFDLGPPPRR